MEFTEKYLEFNKEAITPFHAVNEFEKMLEDNGFIKLFEDEEWKLEKGHKYYVVKSDSSIIGFTLPTDISDLSFNIVASHTDSPTFKLKPNGVSVSNFIKLVTEPYGGMINSTWLDRPISFGGRITYNEDGVIKSALYDYITPFIIPNVAIHQRRELNDGYKYNVDSDLTPLFGLNVSQRFNKFNLMTMIADELDIEEHDIHGADLQLYTCDRGMIGGFDNDLVMAPQIDNLLCAFASFDALVNSKNKKSVNLAVSFNNEEVGSLSVNGASSTFLKDTYKRICEGLGLSKEQTKICISKSFLVSADNGHSDHPNAPSVNDPTNKSMIGEGIVIKTSASLSYSTDSISKTVFESILDKSNIPHQTFANKSSSRGGSTLGRLSLEQLSIATIDIGIAQLAMHSAYETASVEDANNMALALKSFFNTHISKEKGNYLVK